MKKEDELYSVYIDILNKELLPAMGCTEPIAVAYCAAKAKEVLGSEPDRIVAEVSGNIIKNVKSVIVPNTNGSKGIETAVAIGMCGGNPYKELEVISEATDLDKSNMKKMLERKVIKVVPLDSTHPLDIVITAYCGGESASVHIMDDHTNIVEIKRNGQIISVCKSDTEPDGNNNVNAINDYSEYELLGMEEIYDFAMTVDLADIKEVIDRQIEYNTNISKEGLAGNYGANIGSVLLESFGDDIKVRAKAMAAAGSDARMNGCELPVVINSGSGNQGLTVSMPLIEYAKELGSSEEQLYRALVISNLTSIHIKTAIGRLSAYCGAVSAGASAGAGIAYLSGGGYKEVAHTVVNALAITSGIICDGAKASCAAKIASAVDAGILGYEMYKQGQQFYGGDGIISKGIENTIKNIGNLGQKGMFETDKEIIRIMTCVD